MTFALGERRARTGDVGLRKAWRRRVDHAAPHPAGPKTARARAWGAALGMAGLVLATAVAAQPPPALPAGFESARTQVAEVGSCHVGRNGSMSVRLVAQGGSQNFGVVDRQGLRDFLGALCAAALVAAQPVRVQVGLDEKRDIVSVTSLPTARK